MEGKMNANDLEQAIIRVISDASQKLIENQNHSDTDWTATIFTNLTKHAYDLNLRVWSKRNEADPTLTECLYDLMICEGKTAIDIDKVWVALESEWSLKFDEIKYDFYKLVQSRSMLRVMIFQSRDVERIDIYDVNDEFVNYRTGYSADGNISWTWDLFDYSGNSRNDDSDPYFYPYIIITQNSTPGGPSQPYYQSTNTNPRHVRPSAYVGWNTEIGANTNGWGTIDQFWNYRETWAGQWSLGQSGQETLKNSLNDAENFTQWASPSQIDGALCLYGFWDLQYRQYNYGGDWP